MTAVLRYEWRRLVSIRSTWVMVAVAAAVSLALGYLIGALAEFGVEPTVATVSTVFATSAWIGVIFLSVVAAQSFGQEYRHGVIRITLATFPQRWRVMVGKGVMVVAVVAVGAVIAGAAGFVGGLLRALQGGTAPTLAGAEEAMFMARVLVCVVLYCLIVFALTALLRNMALGITIPIVLAVIVEPLIAVFGGSEMPLRVVLPFSAASEAMTLDAVASGGAGPWAGLAVFAAWTTAMLAAAWLVIDRRDA
jgi:ABC-2 type transport system permease protein